MSARHQRSTGNLARKQSGNWVEYSAPNSDSPTPAGLSRLQTEGLHSPSPSPSPRKARETEAEKIDSILAHIRQKHLTLPRLLYLLFREKDENGKDVRSNRSRSHIGTVSSFLQGASENKVTEIVDLMYRNRYSRPPPDTFESGMMQVLWRK
ncbi:hypothetical protein K474DRAFT_1705166 [Panus rudis PR-1116 ss-1]|nr:hypothetical protein K474DRAFT_1705166 [Panus rudis PR-1116 ss-1]